MFAPSIAFVDLETTGTVAGRDRITEVGIVRIENGTCVSEWSTLVDPQCSIPAPIQALTGITNAMVRGAPRFDQIATDVSARIDGAVFVAHNARFDYAFLKHEFGRVRRPFSAKVLCTVKLSRRLYPDGARHNLDAVIAHHGLHAIDRHRALGDARVLWEFIRALYRRHSRETVDNAIRRILKTPSLPPQLAPGTLDAIPEGPGVYRFYGLNPLPLYIGKSVNLRERIGSHFSSDYRNANDLRLSTEVTRIEFDSTAGELGALLLESRLIKQLLPAYNHRLRRCSRSVALRLSDAAAAPEYVCASAIDPAALDRLYGPFASRASARAMLRDVASATGLCWNALGLEHRPGPCFARQIRRCGGACVGAETPNAHHERLRQALAPYVMKPWPYPGAVTVREQSIDQMRTDVHVFRDWRWLGTAQNDASLNEITAQAAPAEFDLDIYRLLVKSLPKLACAPV